ncbi:MAG: sugar phosphate isomerase/epimerase family protein [Gemmataceae bacterium]
MIRVGNQSAFSAHPLTAPFDFALAHGFDAFEWFPDKRPDGAGWVAADLSAADRQQIRGRARDAGVSLSVHAPVTADVLNPRTHRDLEDSLRLAIDLGAGLLNFHLSDPRRVEEFARALQPWCDRCGISGVKLAVENVPATGPDDFNRLFTLLPRNGVGMCLDVGHANLHPGTRNDYIGYVDRLAAEVPITHLHLHENDGDRDSHLPLFTGPAGRDAGGVAALLDRLARRGFSGSGILEQWPQPPELLVRARERLTELARGKFA